MLKCHECAFEATNTKGLSYHVRIRHNKAYPDYLVEHEMGGSWPLCGCGCGGKVRFLCGKFCAHMQGHQNTNRQPSEITRQRIGDAQRGRRPSPETLAKRSASMIAHHAKCPESREGARKALLGSKRSETTKKKHSDTRKRMFASGELTINREKISRSVTKLYLDGGFQWCVGKYHSPKAGKEIAYRSSWELTYAKLLDADPDVTSWEYEPFAIAYELNGERKRYIPDFLVTYADGSRELVEVKPKELEGNAVNQAKRLAAVELCEGEGWAYAAWSQPAA